MESISDRRYNNRLVDLNISRLAQADKAAATKFVSDIKPKKKSSLRSRDVRGSAEIPEGIVHTEE